MGSCFQIITNDNKNQKVPKRLSTQDQLTSHESKAFLISCMDFRLIDDMVRAMDSMGYNNNYDQFILAGSSLGLTQTKFEHWGKSAIDHMEIGKQLHHFREIIIIDHMDCGAYKKFYPEISCKDDELKLHHENFHKAYQKLAAKFPNLTFRAFLMEIDGSFNEVFLKTQENAHDGIQDEHEEAKTKFLADIKKC